MEKTGESFRQEPIRTLILFFLLLFAFGGFLLSIFKTISQDRHLPPRTATIHDRALRGKIISRDGYTLSRSSKTYQATLFTQSIDPDKRELLIHLFAIYSGLDEKALSLIIENNKGYTVLADKIDANTAIRLKSLAYKLRRLKVFRTIKNKRGVALLYGLDITENGEERFFPLGDTLSPVLGYVKNTDDGKYTEVKGVKGLERSYDKYLNSHQNGFVRGMRDVGSTIIRNKLSVVEPRKDGMNIHLNIPLDLQRRVELTLDQMKSLTHAKEIIAGVMESQTGKVIALASSERYDPGHIQKKDVYNLNPKFSEFLYEPGSVMKPITLAIALEHSKVTPDTWIDTKGGKLKISARYTISDDEVFDSLTATDVIVHSSNVGISKIVWKLSGKTFYRGLKRFGFGSSTGIDLSRELPGKIKTTKQLSNRLQRANQAYGYGMMVSFVQLLKAYSAFNNNGTAVTPRLTAYLQENRDRKYRIPPQIGDLRPISKRVSKQMKEILKKVVSNGTGKATIYPGLEIGGKTGTAHIVENRQYIDKYNSSFYGFANDKEGNKYTIGVIAMRLDKQHMHFASQSSVPTFKKIVTNLVELGYLKPDFSVIQQQNLDARERKRQEVAKLRQRRRTKAIKAKLKKERREIKRKRGSGGRKKKRKTTIRERTESQKALPPKKSKKSPVPHEGLPNLF